MPCAAEPRALSGRAAAPRARRGTSLRGAGHGAGHARADRARMPEIENQLRLVGRVGLAMQVSQVSPNGRFRDAQSRGNHLVLQAAAAQRQHLPLALRQAPAARQRGDRLQRQRWKLVLGVRPTALGSALSGRTRTFRTYASKKSAELHASNAGRAGLFVRVGTHSRHSFPRLSVPAPVLTGVWRPQFVTRGAARFSTITCNKARAGPVENGPTALALSHDRRRA